MCNFNKKSQLLTLSFMLTLCFDSIQCCHWHCSGHRRGFITCFGNDGGVLASARLVAEATDVFAVHSKGILVPHDQVRHSAAGPAVVLINQEPLLMWERQTERQRDEKQRFNEAFSQGWDLYKLKNLPSPASMFFQSNFLSIRTT